MQICGITRFLTQKLSWSLVNKFPVSSCFKENYVKFSIYINFFSTSYFVINGDYISIALQNNELVYISIHLLYCRGRHGLMVVGFITTCAISAITTKVVSSNSIHGEVYLIQHDVIKFISNLHQISGFLQVLWLPPPIKLTATI